MDAPPPDQNNHGHKTRKEGRGAKEAKKDKKAKVAGTRVEKHNNRAFSVANIVRTQRTLQRNSDRKHKKEYVPQKDRRAAKDSNEAPPSLVVVMGPPGVGKVSLPHWEYRSIWVWLVDVVHVPAYSLHPRHLIVHTYSIAGKNVYQSQSHNCHGSHHRGDEQ